jgi:hypothetical protein
VTKCFNDLDTPEKAFGSGAAIVLSPVILAGSLVSYFQSQLNVLGDEFNGRDRYRITISRRADSRFSRTTGSARWSPERRSRAP